MRLKIKELIADYKNRISLCDAQLRCSKNQKDSVKKDTSTAAIDIDISITTYKIAMYESFLDELNELIK